MPIYAYKCGSCGHAKDVLQKVSDTPLTTCPACGQESFSKQLTAPGFQLKGSGWYATDFRNNGTKPADKKADTASSDASSSDAAKPADPSTSSGQGKPADSKPAESSSATKTDTTASSGGSGKSGA